MCEAEVKDEGLHQRPILLIVVIVYNIDLQLLQPLEHQREFRKNYQSAEAKEGYACGGRKD